MFKYTIRNGFRMAEDHYENLELIEKLDGKQVSKRIQLRQIEQADVRDMASAIILKIVYQFTKTIKITGGGQVLLYNDMLEDETDFLRQALLAEMEKNFVVYKNLFFCISVHDILTNGPREPLMIENSWKFSCVFLGNCDLGWYLCT